MEKGSCLDRNRPQNDEARGNTLPDQPENLEEQANTGHGAQNESRKATVNQVSATGKSYAYTIGLMGVNVAWKEWSRTQAATMGACIFTEKDEMWTQWNGGERRKRKTIQVSEVVNLFFTDGVP